MNVANATTAATLLAKAAKVRSFYADPVNKLGNERSLQEDASHQLRQQGDSFALSAQSLEQAQASVKVLGQMWSEGKLSVLQDLAAQLAERSAGNPFASIALGTRQMLSGLGVDGPSSEEMALGGAVVLAGSLGSDPARYAENFNQGLREAYSRLPDGLEVEGAVDPQQLYHFADRLDAQRQQSHLAAEDKYEQAKAQWKGVNAIQDQLEVHFQGRRKGLHFAQKKAAAQDFMSSLKAASLDSPEIIREMRTLAKETGQPMMYDPSGLLNSYDAQMAKTGNVDWNRMVRSFERTSFGR